MMTWYTERHIINIMLLAYYILFFHVIIIF